MKQDEIRQKLIDGTIRVIGRDGLDKATTKQIGMETSVNEGYIYRYFDGKEDLFARTFDTLDDEFATNAMKSAVIIFSQGMELDTGCRRYFSAVWQFLLSNQEKCLTYIRYYYSPYFPKNSAQSHKKRWVPVVNMFSVAFKTEADVWMILNHVFSVALEFAAKVYSGQMPNDEDHAEHVYRVIYRAVEQYFKANAG